MTNTPPQQAARRASYRQLRFRASFAATPSLAARPLLAAGPLLLLMLAGGLGGCGLYHPVSADERDATSACNAEVDRVFAAQNRYQLSERDSSASPYAGSSLPYNPSTGLSDRYQQDQMVDKCLARSGGEPAAAPETAPAKP